MTFRKGKIDIQYWDFVRDAGKCSELMDFGLCP
jgi:hypothetical protein